MAYKNPVDIHRLRESSTYREALCREIYDDEALYGNVKRYIMQRGGSDDDAQEVFQESIVRFFKKAMSEVHFEVEKNLPAYLFGICKLTFLSNLKKTGQSVPIDDESIGLNIEEHQDEALKIFENEALYNLLMQNASESCRQVLMYWSYNYRMEKIAELMHYKSEMMARKKKYECIQKMMEFVKKNGDLINNFF